MRSFTLKFSWSYRCQSLLFLNNLTLRNYISSSLGIIVCVCSERVHFPYCFHLILSLIIDFFNLDQILIRSIREAVKRQSRKKKVWYLKSFSPFLAQICKNFYSIKGLCHPSILRISDHSSPCQCWRSIWSFNLLWEALACQWSTMLTLQLSQF